VGGGGWGRGRLEGRRAPNSGPKASFVTVGYDLLSKIRTEFCGNDDRLPIETVMALVSQVEPRPVPCLLHNNHCDPC
jgi:hypothetical protein